MPSVLLEVYIFSVRCMVCELRNLAPMIFTRTYPVRTPRLAQLLLRKRIYQGPDVARRLYLSFDDGPTPGITEWVLEKLAEAGATATFFCVGSRVAQHPELLRRMVREGHTIGNHTYHHPHGWKIPVADYMAEVEATDRAIEAAVGFRPRFFRPPYGKLAPTAAGKIRQTHRIVLWDVLPGDFDPRVNGQRVAHRVISNARRASVVVLHDSDKCASTLRAGLPVILRHYKAIRWELRAIPPSFGSREL